MKGSAPSFPYLERSQWIAVQFAKNPEMKSFAVI
jgi:hypothetical protein